MELNNFILKISASFSDEVTQGKRGVESLPQEWLLRCVLSRASDVLVALVAAVPLEVVHARGLVLEDRVSFVELTRCVVTQVEGLVLGAVIAAWARYLLHDRFCLVVVEPWRSAVEHLILVVSQ